MHWHCDMPLYQEPQYECVYTLSNTTDSTTQWKKYTTSCLKGEEEIIKEVSTKANSLILVKADAVEHQVTPVTYGDRYILKFIYTTTFAKTPEFYEEAEFARESQANKGVALTRKWNEG